MKTLLKIYLILIFASNALNAGSENDSIKMRYGFAKEATNFAGRFSYPQNLEGIAECMASERPIDNKAIKEARQKDGSAQ